MSRNTFEKYNCYCIYNFQKNYCCCIYVFKWIDINDWWDENTKLYIQQSKNVGPNMYVHESSGLSVWLIICNLNCGISNEMNSLSSQDDQLYFLWSNETTKCGGRNYLLRTSIMETLSCKNINDKLIALEIFKRRKDMWGMRSRYSTFKSCFAMKFWKWLAQTTAKWLCSSSIKGYEFPDSWWMHCQNYEKKP